MLGKLDPSRKEVTIVGAGVAGLLAAYHLDKQGYEVTLLEATERAGGLIQTAQTEFGIAESGAHSILATAVVQSFARDIGLELTPLRKDSRARYIVRNGLPRSFPLKPREALAALLRAYFVLADTRAPAARLSLERWAARHLGTPALQYLFTPFIRGVYGAEPREVTVGAAFPSLVVPAGHSLLSHFFGKAIRAPFRSKAKAAPPRVPGEFKKQMMVPAGGMGSLVAKLEERLKDRLGERFKKKHPVEILPSAPNVILAVPASVAASLLDSVDPQLSAALRSVPYTPMVSVTAFVARSSMPREIRGIGVLAPAVEGRDALGILFNSSSFAGRVANEDTLASFTVMMGGSAHPEWLTASDERIHAAVSQELKELLGVQQAPVHMVIHRWKRAIPQYGIALQDCWDAAQDGWCAQPGRMLFGNFTGQVSLRGMIESAASLS